MFLGIDAFTQSVTAVVIDPSSGAIVCQHSVNFGGDLPDHGAPDGFIPGGENGEVRADPRMWLEALELLPGRLVDLVDLSKVTLIAGSGQQHGSAYLDETSGARLAVLDVAMPLADQLAPVLTRATDPIWIDTATAAECAEIRDAVDGASEVCRRSGSVAIQRFTGPQIRRLFKQDPAAYARTAQIHRVSPFMDSVIAGRPAPVDLGDGAEMNLLDFGTGALDPALLETTAPDLGRRLPRPASATEVQGPISAWLVG